MNGPDDFYIGWADRAPASHRRTLRRIAMGLLVAAGLVGLGLAAAQRQIGTATFEWGQPRPFQGILHTSPIPHLILAATNPAGPAPISAPLVAPFKFGVKPEAICSLEGQLVQVQATRIAREDQLMLEVTAESLQALASGPSPNGPAPAPATARLAPPPRRSLGTRSFVGEIVDSKCWLGVMNPGTLATHRACAIRCLSGGIPPLLVVPIDTTTATPPLAIYLVASPHAPWQASDESLAHLVGRPVQIAGELFQQGSLLFLQVAGPITPWVGAVAGQTE